MDYNSSEEINDESDHEDQIGYHTRSKRRKVCGKFENSEKSLEGTSTRCKIPEVGKRKNPIMFVPTEVLENVFRYLSFHDLSTVVRLVNRRFKIVSENILNLAFKRIEDKLNTLTSSTELSLGFTQDDMEIKCITKLLSMLEILKIQYTIIFSTIWRYVYNKYYKSKRTCMYGGLIIDFHFSFLWKFTHSPYQLYAPAVLKEYALPVEVNKIVQMTKTFCVHFDKVSEEPLCNSVILSGCKIVDILNSAKFATKTVCCEECTPEIFIGKYHYFFHNAWFIALPIPVTKEMDWSQKQRMMHMRLRRVVLAHNDMYLQQHQYEREIIVRPQGRVKKPGNNVYTGYGDVEDTFFYYGVMNDGAYMQKFDIDDDNDIEDDEEGAAEVVPVAPANMEGVVRLDSDVDILYRLPHLGFCVNVDVRCPPQYAPLNYLQNLGQKEKVYLEQARKIKGGTEISMQFECRGAYYPRLPTYYTYDFKPKRS